MTSGLFFRIISFKSVAVLSDNCASSWYDVVRFFIVDWKALVVTGAGISNEQHNLDKPVSPFPLSIPPCISHTFIDIRIVLNRMIC